MAAHAWSSIRARRFTDPALVVLFYVVDLLTSWNHLHANGFRPDLVIPLYAAAGCALLLVRRRFPLTVLTALVVHNLLAALLIPGYLPLMAVWVALFTVAATCSRRRALVGLALALPPTVTNVLGAAEHSAPGRRVPVAIAAGSAFLLFTAAAWATGRWAEWSTRQRRIVARMAAAEAARTERAVLAREMHDILAHTMTVMGLQSAGARKLVRGDPDAAEAALARVDELSRQAHAELRQLLSVVGVPGDGPEQAVPHRWRDVPDLVARVSATGLPVRCRQTGTARPLDSLTDLAGYRVLQEALTNALRHGSRTDPVEVSIAWSADRLTISVANRVARRSQLPATGSGGHGLTGMTERVAAAGGRLEIDHDRTSFRVTAVLPVLEKDRRVVDLSEPARTGER